VNVDFEDVKTVMKDSGGAVMGSAAASGEGRALRAAAEALNSPLLNNTDIHGAQKILLSIMYGEEDELQMSELDEITSYIEERTG
jgi:cell division protein FtsZ